MVPLRVVKLLASCETQESRKGRLFHIKNIYNYLYFNPYYYKNLIILYLSYFVYAGVKAPNTQIKGGKVYFVPQLVDISIHSPLYLREGRMAKRHDRGATLHSNS